MIFYILHQFEFWILRAQRYYFFILLHFRYLQSSYQKEFEPLLLITSQEIYLWNCFQKYEWLLIHFILIHHLQPLFAFYIALILVLQSNFKSYLWSYLLQNALHVFPLIRVANNKNLEIHLLCIELLIHSTLIHQLIKMLLIDFSIATLQQFSSNHLKILNKNGNLSYKIPLLYDAMRNLLYFNLALFSNLELIWNDWNLLFLFLLHFTTIAEEAMQKQG